MRAVCFDGTSVRVRERPVPTPTDAEALVRVRRAGVCSTDLEIARGYGGFVGIMGHEMVGHVEACPADPAWVGRRVAPEINLACGACGRCRAGLRNHCERRRVLGIARADGCFAEYVVVPRENLHAVPDVVGDEVAVFIEPLAAAYAILQQVEIAASDRVLVLGDGKLGLLVAMVLHAHGCALVHAGRHADKLAITERLGVRTVLPDAQLPRDFDVVVEATGSPGGVAQALAHVRPRGTVVLKTTVAAPTVVDTNRIVTAEIRVVGSRCGPFDVAIAALAQGRVDPRPLVAARYALHEGDRAVEHAARPGTLKILIAP